MRPNTNTNSPNVVTNVRSNVNSAATPDANIPIAVGFNSSSVCSLPRNLTGGSPFAGLGGGTWEKWEDNENGFNYSCSGGTDSLKLEEVVAKIRGGYSALGDREMVRAVSATYIALQYGGKTKEESALRPKYADFCDLLSRNLFGEPLPESIRKRIMDEALAGKANGPEFSEKVGQGLITLGVRKEKTDLLRLEVNFFPTEADFKKFKNS